MLARLSDGLRYSILGITLAVIGFFLWVFYSGQRVPEAASYTISAKLNFNETDLMMELGLSGPQWVELDIPKFYSDVREWDPHVVKALFVLTADDGKRLFLVSKKRRQTKGGGKMLSKRWEFVGGGVEPRETPWDALRRELLEEDPSHILEKIFGHILEKPGQSLVYRNVALNDGQRHTLFQIPLPKERWDEMSDYYAQHPLDQDDSSESLGFLLVKLDALSLQESIKYQWTPKSRKILSALHGVQSE